MRLARYLTWMTVFLMAVFGVAAWLAPRLESIFFANPFLNALLIAVWLVGVIYIFAQTLRLGPEIQWVRAVQRNRLAINDMETPPLMGPFARLMEDRATPLMLTPQALRSVLDGVAVRLDESREIARYFTGLMIFLGLLGTFWGLLRTVGSVGAVVGTLSITADPTELFNTLKAGLEGPLAGMGTAFSSSLLGLAGSLVLGFLDLQMGQAQNRFFIDLEDWLFASSRGDRTLGSDNAPTAYLQALVEQTAENIEQLRQVMLQSEDGRRQSAQAIQSLAERVGALAGARSADRMQSARSTEADAALLQVLGGIERALSVGISRDDVVLSGHVQAIEDAVQRIAEDQVAGRTQALQEIRGEIKLVARMIGAAIDNPVAE